MNGIFYGKVLEGTAFNIKAKVRDLVSEKYITQAGLSAITWSLYDKSSATPDTMVANGTITIATSVFDELKLSPGWKNDKKGYNFSAIFPATLLTVGNHTYKLEIVFTPVSGTANNQRMIWFIEVVDTDAN